MTDQAVLDRRRAVLDIITTHPERHSQVAWEMRHPNECATTRCVAGWAIWAEDPNARNSYVARQAIARRFGLSEASYQDTAQALLGLTYAEAYELFFFADDDEAVELLRQYADDSESVQHLDGFDPDLPDFRE